MFSTIFENVFKTLFLPSQLEPNTYPKPIKKHVHPVEIKLVPDK